MKPTLFSKELEKINAIEIYILKVVCLVAGIFMSYGFYMMIKNILSFH